MSQSPGPATKGLADVPMDHEYDGITEYDNPLPRWWVLIFWATFLFAMGYFFHYHLSGKGRGRLAEFDADVRVANDIAMKAASKEQVSEESLAKLVDNAASQAAGAAIFAARCQSCHAEQGKGLIGPNLTDGYWLHGSGRLMDIFDSVSNGVLAKGMPAWSKQLAPMELRNVVAYVGNLRGKNLPGKEPQGEAVGVPAKTPALAPTPIHQ
jgi:cytochrome c oxidase cbb3-type subunit III